MTVAAGVLAATALSASACVAFRPTPLPSLPSPVVSTLPTTRSSSTPTGPPTLAVTQGAWATYQAAWQSCRSTATTPVIIPAAVEVPQDLVPVGDCAILFYGTSGNLWIASPTGLAKFPEHVVNPDPVTGHLSPLLLAADPAGVWVATFGPSNPALTFTRPDGALQVDLPSRTIGINAIRTTAGGLLVAVDTGDYSGVTGKVGSLGGALLSVSADGVVTTVWSAPGLSIRAIATDGATTVVTGWLLDAPASFVATDYGGGWQRLTVPAGNGGAVGIAAQGERIVVMSQKADDQGIAPVGTMTSVSADRGATWTSTETPVGDAGTLLGFHDGTAIAKGVLNTAPLGLVQMTDAGDWIPFATVPDPPANIYERDVALTTCGVWMLDATLAPSSDRLMTHVALPGPGC